MKDRSEPSASDAAIALVAAILEAVPAPQIAVAPASTWQASRAEPADLDSCY